MFADACTGEEGSASMEPGWAGGFGCTEEGQQKLGAAGWTWVWDPFVAVGGCPHISFLSPPPANLGQGRAGLAAIICGLRQLI